MKTPLVGTLALMLAAVTPAHAAPPAQVDFDALEQAALEVANAFVQGLAVALKNELAKGGPAGAISVCKEVAPQIASTLSRAHGWRVTRVGTRVRTGGADTIVRQASADRTVRPSMKWKPATPIVTTHQAETNNATTFWSNFRSFPNLRVTQNEEQ